MRITRIEIKNFRSIRHLAMDLGETTVLVGPNNAGKTAILDALRIALTRRWGQRGTGFSEYDIHMTDKETDPKASSGVTIDIMAEERESGEWPDAITQDLGDIVQVSLANNRRSVRLRTRCMWNRENEHFEPSWEFLDAGRKPLGGAGARRINLERFWRYLPVFYLGALRDAGDEFSARSSQFWNRLLKDLNIPPELESHALEVLDLLNQKLLKADPRLENIAKTLSGATKVAARDTEGGLSLTMVPLKTWDLLSRAEIILRNEADLPWLPLRRQGQGIQSLSVIFLFQAFVDHLLHELYEPGSEPVLALEEPETHLHPQAVRTLWRHVDELAGQKIVTTHSPYFVQHVPFRDLRLVRLKSGQTEVRSLPATFSVSIPKFDGLEAIVNKSAGLLSYEPTTELLTVYDILDEDTYRNLLTCCGQGARRAEIEAGLRDLRDRSSHYVTNDELQALNTHARRIRGEIFFAERWLIVEGQSDYLIVHAIAHALDYDLDRHGVSVIDAQNNGSPATFAALARALDIPWLAVFDGDDAGNNFIQGIRNRRFDETEIKTRCHTHPDGCIEEQLVADGLGSELREMLATTGTKNAHNLDDSELVHCLKNNKTRYAAELSARIRCTHELAARTPAAFRNAIEQLRGLA